MFSVVIGKKWEKKSVIIFSLLAQITSLWLLNIFIYLEQAYASIILCFIYTIIAGYALGASLLSYLVELLPPSAIGVVFMFVWIFSLMNKFLIKKFIEKMRIGWLFNIYLSKYLSFPPMPEIVFAPFLSRKIKFWII